MDENMVQNESQQGQVQNAPAFVTLLVLSILSTCCCNTITGIAGIILIVLANQDYKAGNIEAYESKKKITTIVLIVGLVLSIIVLALYGFEAYNQIMAEMQKLQ